MAHRNGPLVECITILPFLGSLRLQTTWTTGRAFTTVVFLLSLILGFSMAMGSSEPLGSESFLFCPHAGDGIGKGAADGIGIGGVVVVVEVALLLCHRVLTDVSTIYVFLHACL